jgi:hypothetical protein
MLYVEIMYHPPILFPYSNTQLRRRRGRSARDTILGIVDGLNRPAGAEEVHVAVGWNC